MTTKKIKYGLKELIRDYGPLTFAGLIESHRLCEEMSQKDFAKKLGIAPSTLCDLEKGRKIPTPKRAAAIAKKLGMFEMTWITAALQDELRANKMNYIVKLEKAS
jgi:transcriptional regulator with XRE-family HTH domain